jgi:hypothetical protein
MKNIIVGQTFIHSSEKVCPLARLQCLARETIKTQTVCFLLFVAYSKGEGIFEG